MTETTRREVPAWARDPETLERIFLAAVGAGDPQGVESALTLMASCDPHRAQELLDSLRVGLSIAQAPNPASVLRGMAAEMAALADRAEQGTEVRR